MAIARNQHFVSQGYLAGFTDTGTTKGKLWVSDLVNGSRFFTRPRNVASQRDFNQTAHSPDALEKQLAIVEGKAAAVIPAMCKSGQVPPDDDFSYVLNLMCLFVVRNPKYRRMLTAAKQQSTRITLDLLASDQALYEHYQRKALAAGDISKTLPFERFRESVEQYAIEIPTHANLRTEFSAFNSVLESLCSRCWSMLIAAPDAPDFITCDHPVVLFPKRACRGGPIGCDTRQTELTFALDARHALVAVFEDPLPREFEATPKMVAAVNTRILDNADRQVYSRESVISVLQRGEIVAVQLGSENAA